MPAAPSDVTFQVAAERFNDHGTKVEYMVTMEAPLKELTFTPQPDQKTSMIDAALLAVVKNSSGEIVEKFSKDLQCRSLWTKSTHIRKGIWFRLFELNCAGSYSLEAALMDRNGKRLALKRVPSRVATVQQSVDE